MPAMLQDGRVIVVVFVAFSLLIETNLASSENGKCRYCKELIQSLLTSNNPLSVDEGDDRNTDAMTGLINILIGWDCRDTDYYEQLRRNQIIRSVLYIGKLMKQIQVIAGKSSDLGNEFAFGCNYENLEYLWLFEEKSSFAENFSENIAEENVPIISKLDLVIFCLDNCVASGDKTENDENNSVRGKRDVTDGIYKYFSPPFSHITNDQSEQGVSEAAEELQDTAKLYESSRRAYQGYVRDRRVGSGCECVREQEESVKRLIQMIEKYTERIIELFRGMVREEINNQMLPERRREITSVGHQQNYFMISILTPNSSNPPAQFVTPNTLPAIETTTAGQIVEDPETHATSEAKTDLTTTTEIPQKGTEAAEETTTEVTIDLPESNVMRQSDDELPPDCENKDHGSPQHLPALLQAFRPQNT